MFQIAGGIVLAVIVLLVLAWVAGGVLRSGVEFLTWLGDAWRADRKAFLVWIALGMASVVVMVWTDCA